MGNEMIVSKSDLARRIGRSPARVSQFIREGRLTAPALLEDGRIDLEAALVQLAPFLMQDGPLQPKPARPPAAPSPMAEAKLALARAQVAKVEAELAASRGAYERAAMNAVKRAGERVGALLVDLLDLRLATLVGSIRAAATERSAFTVAKAADDELRHRFCRELSAEVAKIGEGPPGSPLIAPSAAQPLQSGVEELE